MYAEIAVNRPISNTFHYHIPASLHDQIVPGHLVKIAFGTAHSTGIVIALHHESPIPETKPILERLDPHPVLTPVQIELARWLSAQTLTPLGPCLWLMLPPGLAKRSDTLYTLVGTPPETLTPRQQRVVSLLARRGPLRGRQLAHALPHMHWQPVVSNLVKQGLVEQTPVLDPPDVKPQIVRTVTLALPVERIPAVAPHLGSESQRANVLEVLLATPENRMSLSALLIAAGCGEGPVRALADSGDIWLEPKQSWIELIPPADQVRASLASGNLRLPPTQRAALEQMLDGDQPLPGSAVSSRMAKALEDAGLIRRWTTPALVTLQRSTEEIRQRIIELRGGQPYLDILNYLAGETGPVSLTQVYAATGTNLSRIQRLADDGLVVLGEAESLRDPLANQEFVPTLAPPLTADQAQAWNIIRQHMDSVHWGEISPPPENSGVFLLHGVTGSGKTEIYMRAVERALAQGRQALVLVPEIALTPQTVRRFAARFPGKVSIVHSDMTHGERYDTWRRARAGELQVIVGARSALFTPLPDIGLIILDEEHDDSYKHSPPLPPPYYHARETAIALMRLNHGTVLLGSATPDVVTYFRAQRGQYTLLELPERIIAHRERIAEQVRRLNAPSARYHPIADTDALSAALPTVEIVDMRQELRSGNRSIFSGTLSEALTEVLSRHEQAILFLNRRGTATFVMCRDCGTIVKCPRCDTPLTYHGPYEKLMCHYCGYSRDPLSHCAHCHSQRIKHFGQGTELIESATQEAFPQARILRWDRDTATNRAAHEAILQQFSAGEADILIGTQMIAKGLDLPRVTLVGIISADTALGLPDFRAAERTFQLLTQVAGRAGRGALGGHVILQSYQPEHYAIQAAATHNYAAFFRQEIAYRQEQRYPPFRRLARLVFQYPTPTQAEQEARRAATLLERHIEEGQFTATEIIGPTPCFFARLRNLYRWHLIIRSPDPSALLRGMSIGADWFLDIDPVDIL